MTNVGLVQLAGVQPAHAAVVTSTILNEGFDGVAPPALPSGWTATRAAGQNNDQTWRTSTPALIDGPNSVSVGANGRVTDMILESPPFQAGVATRVQFYFSMNLQAMTGQFSGDKVDGGVLEIKIGTAAYVDFVGAGGFFPEGEGYTHRIANTQDNPLGGRMGWSHIRAGGVHNGTLPISASGNTVRLRWRLGTSKHTANQGGPNWFLAQAWVIDNVKVFSDRTTQTISFTGPVNPQAFTTYTPTATATSGLPVTFSIASGSVCSLATGVVTFESPGPCTIQADQAGNAIYAPANRVSQTISVVKADQTVYFTSTPSNPQVGTKYTPTAGTSSGGPITLSIAGTSSSVCSINAANLVTFNATGPCVIQADQAGNSNLNPAQATQTVNVVAATPPTCSFTIVAGPPKYIDFTVRAPNGLASIEVTTSSNVLTPVPIPAFTSGTTETITFSATKDNQSLPAQIAVAITDTAGLVASCT